MSITTSRLAVLFALIWLHAGCGNDGGHTTEDSGTDTTTGNDVLFDTEDDPIADTETDLEEDGLDVVEDVPTDSPADAPEICTSDGDCDDDDACTEDTCDETAGTCLNELIDADDDGHGLETGPGGEDCGGTDCNDDEAGINPDAVEDQCDLIDSDCDGSNTEHIDDDLDYWIDDVCDTMTDTTGYSGLGDCNDDPADGGATIFPGATEVCNRLDDDCDGTADDGNPGGGAECAVTGLTGICVSGETFCTDGTVTCTQTVFPMSEECNNLDDNCDGTVDEDNPGGGAACAVSGVAGICQDGEMICTTGSLTCTQTVFPMSEDCNTLDDDCDSLIDELSTTTFYRDADDDGYGDLGDFIEACSLPAGYSSNFTDCDDSSASIHPGALEICDGIFDHDCNGAVDEGCPCTLGSTRDCGPTDPGGAWLTQGECQTGTQTCIASSWASSCGGAVYPTAEACNGLDDDCDGDVDEGGAGSAIFYRDADDDGYGDLWDPIEACFLPADYSDDPGDCDDTDGSVHPGAVEACDGADNDCDGMVDEGCP